MNAKDALVEIKKLLFSGDSSEKKFALTEGKLVDGTIISYDYGTAEIYVVGADGVSVPAPVGEHQLETGEVLVVKQEGVIAEVKEAEKPQEEAQSEPMSAEVKPTEDMPVKEDKMAKLEEGMTSLTKKVEEMGKKVDELYKKNQEMNEIVKLSTGVLETLATETSAKPVQEPNNFAKIYKSEKEKRFTNLQTAFANLKK